MFPPLPEVRPGAVGWEEMTAPAHISGVPLEDGIVVSAPAGRGRRGDR